VPGYFAIKFQNEYAAAKFTSNGDDAGVMGATAYDSGT
jgi:hypothetical protein